MSILFKFGFFHTQRFQSVFTMILFGLTTSSIITSTTIDVFHLPNHFNSMILEVLSCTMLGLLFWYPLPDRKKGQRDPLNIYQTLFNSFQFSKRSKFSKVLFLLTLVPWECLGVYSGLEFFYHFSFLKVLIMGRFLFATLNHPMSPWSIKGPVITSMVVLAIHGISFGWLIIEGYQDEWVTAYNKAFYWSMTTLTTIGYGDITPTSNISRVYTTFIMVIGVGVYGIIFGNISRMLLNADRHKEAKKEKINDISAFLKHYEIPNRLKKEVFSYYHSMFSRHLSDKDNTIIGELPSVLQDELKLYMKVRLIKELSIFQDTKLNCLRLIATLLETRSYSPGQTIIKKGDVGEEMFIIAHGEVDVIVEGNIVASILEGQFFGEIALVQNVTRTADVHSKSYCELYTLKKDDFHEIIQKFPELEKRFQKQYQKRSSDQKKSASLKKVS